MIIISPQFACYLFRKLGIRGFKDSKKCCETRKITHEINFRRPVVVFSDRGKMGREKKYYKICCPLFYSSVVCDIQSCQNMVAHFYLIKQYITCLLKVQNVFRLRNFPTLLSILIIISQTKNYVLKMDQNCRMSDQMKSSERVAYNHGLCESRSEDSCDIYVHISTYSEFSRKPDTSGKKHNF